MTACNVEVGDIDAVGLMKIVITLQKGDHDRLKERDRHARLQVCSRDIDAHLTRDLSLVRVKAARVQYGGTHVLHQKVNISVIKVIVQKIWSFKTCFLDFKNFTNVQLIADIWWHRFAYFGVRS